MSKGGVACCIDIVIDIGTPKNSNIVNAVTNIIIDILFSFYNTTNISTNKEYLIECY